MKPAAVLEVANVSKRYGMTPALCGVDLEVGAGEWVGLVGPNGAGKTTLTQCIAGLLRPDEGSIDLFCGEPRRRPGSVSGLLGLVPQEVALYPLLTARENLEAFARFCGMTRREARESAEQALIWTRLQDRDCEPVGNFSTGMMRRLNIACGVLHSPKLLLLDEPTVGVDPRSRAAIADMLERLRAQGTALLETSHQLSDLETRCDRIVVMDGGEVVASGTLSELAAQTSLGPQVVRMRLDRPALAPAVGSWRVSGSRMRGTIQDVERELPGILEQVRLSGAVVRDLQIGAPTLEELFDHLTGNEADA